MLQCHQIPNIHKNNKRAASQNHLESTTNSTKRKVSHSHLHNTYRTTCLHRTVPAMCSIFYSDSSASTQTSHAPVSASPAAAASHFMIALANRAADCNACCSATCFLFYMNSNSHGTSVARTTLTPALHAMIVPASRVDPRSKPSHH